jgi:hypothetical protein
MGTSYAPKMHAMEKATGGIFFYRKVA